MPITIDIYDIKLADVIARGLLYHIGEENAITSKTIISKMRPKYKINDVKLRQLIRYLRIEKHMLVAGTANGFFICKNEMESSHQIASLKSRIKALQEDVEALTKSHERTFKQQEIFI